MMSKEELWNEEIKRGRCKGSAWFILPQDRQQISDYVCGYIVKEDMMAGITEEEDEIGWEEGR